MKYTLLLTLLVLTAASCQKKTSSPMATVISDLEISQRTVKGADRNDILYMQFHFDDADGDIGGGTQDIRLVDSRDTGREFEFSLPIIRDEYKNPATGGVSGDAQLALGANLYFIPRADSVHALIGDTLIFKVFMIDQANHKSNVLTTDTIYIVPR